MSRTISKQAPSRSVHFACPSGYALKNHHQTRPMRPVWWRFVALFWHQHLDTGTMRQNCRSKHGCLQAFNISRPTQQITSLSTKMCPSIRQSSYPNEYSSKSSTLPSARAPRSFFGAVARDSHPLPRDPRDPLYMHRRQHPGSWWLCPAEPHQGRARPQETRASALARPGGRPKMAEG